MKQNYGLSVAFDFVVGFHVGCSLDDGEAGLRHVDQFSVLKDSDGEKTIHGENSPKGAGERPRTGGHPGPIKSMPLVYARLCILQEGGKAGR